MFGKKKDGKQVRYPGFRMAMDGNTAVIMCEREASDAAGALETVRTQEIDLALLDLKLAGEDGIALMEELHRLQADLPVIMMTAGRRSRSRSARW